MSVNNKLRDNVERWLIHENYRFKDIKNDENTFCLRVKDVGSFGIPIEIFEPKKQLGVLVLGAKVFFKNRQTARYNNLSDSEREKFHNSVKDYCDSIQTIHKIFKEDGKVVIAVYLVLDKVDRFTQEMVLNSIGNVIEMGEKTSRFVFKTF